MGDGPQRLPRDWEQMYRDGDVESLPWFYPSLDPDLESALARYQVKPGKALDLGTGPATQAIALAERGFEVTGSDLSTAAVERATAIARDKGLAIRFVQDNVLDSRLDDAFQIVFDRGCFHVMAPEQRPVYVETLRRLVTPGGLLFLKCFSTDQPGVEGPYRLSRDDIRSAFEADFEVLSIDDTVYQGKFLPFPKSLFCTLRRR